MESKFLHHEECPKCGSRNNVAVYSNGGRHCFSADCDYHVNGETGEEIQVSTPSTLHMGGVVAEITDRRLSAKTVSKYQVTVDYAPDGTIARHYYPYYDVDTGELVAAKSRLVKNKYFLSSGVMTNVGLFGQKKCRVKASTSRSLRANWMPCLSTRCLDRSTMWCPYALVLLVPLKRSKRT